jgi:D-alanyl-D-alanine endopeptidase (penicillin-binding protein 7)
VVGERTRTVLTEKRADTVLPIASICRLMSAVVSLDAKRPLHGPHDPSPTS